MPHDLADTIAAIRGHHRRRCYAMEQRKRADLALGSFLRLMLGWSKALPDDERKRINDQAKALIAIGEKVAKARAKGKAEPVQGADTEDYAEWADVIEASIQSRAPFDAIEATAEKHMAQLARTLPVYAWAEGIRGFGDVSLAIIVAEAGDIGAYPKKGHLWKRMGVAVMGPGDGIHDIRQGGLSKAASKDDWIAHGYNRQRRSRMWNVGDPLLKLNRDGPYRAAYLARKEYERARAGERGLTVVPAAKIPKARASEFMSDGHVHRRAQRYAEKLLLKHLWQQWRRANVSEPERANERLPAADEQRDAA